MKRRIASSFKLGGLGPSDGFCAWFESFGSCLRGFESGLRGFGSDLRGFGSDLRGFRFFEFILKEF